MRISGMTTDRATAVDEMRRRIYGGGRLLLDSLSKEELEALQPLLFDDEAEIVNEACKPYVIRKLPK